METLLLKLLLTPALIAAASLAGRQWGQAVSGWFVGLPLTSGPIAFFVALDQGVGFAAATALGALAAALRFTPRGSEATATPPPPPWALRARMVIATVLVVLITEAAPLLIERAGIALAFTAAIAATLAIQAASLGLVLRSPKPVRV